MKEFNNLLSKSDLINSMDEEDVFALIKKELTRAESKHNVWPTDQIYAAAVVIEEAGETMKAAVQYEMEGGSIEEIEKEAIQTAATCVRLVKHIVAMRRRADHRFIDKS